MSTSIDLINVLDSIELAKLVVVGITLIGTALSLGISLNKIIKSGILTPLFDVSKQIIEQLLYIEKNNKIEKHKISEEDIENLTRHVLDHLRDNQIDEEATKIAAQRIVNENITAIIDGALRTTNVDKSVITTLIRQEFDNNIEAIASKAHIESLHAYNNIRHYTRLHNKYTTTLNNVCSHEMNSSRSLKRSLISLFVICNFVILFLLIAGYRSNDVFFSGNTAYLIPTFYISLAGFIVYIHRSLNVRTATTLAIFEDTKKTIDALYYIDKLGTQKLTEHNVNIIRALLTNRSEREKQVKHPYEIILSGVSNSHLTIGNGIKLKSNSKAPNKQEEG